MTKPAIDNGTGQIFEEFLLHEPPPLRIRHAKLPIDEVHFDPQNPRLKYKRQLDPNTSDHQLLFSSEDTKWLLKDVAANGILDPIYVVPSADGKGWKVTEGNRRTAVVKELHQKHPDDPKFALIPARILPDHTSPQQESLLMLSFHVAGKLKWEAHEKAGEIWNALNRLHIPQSELINICHMGANAIHKAADAYGLLEHFKQIDGGKYAKEAEGKWSFFAEIFKIKDLRERRQKGGISWDDQFCVWVGEGRIPKAEDVRRLPDILGKLAARKLFENESVETAFEKAIKEVEKSTRPGSKFYNDLGKVIASGRASTMDDQEATKTNEAARDVVLEAYSVITKFMEGAGMNIPSTPRR